MRLPRPLPPCACRAVLGMCHVCVRWRGGKARRPETRSLHYGASVGVAGAGSREQTRTNTLYKQTVASARCGLGRGSWGRGSLRSVSRPNTIYNSRTLACLQTHAEHSTTPEPCPVFAERSYGMCTQYRPKYVHVQVGCHVVRPQNGTLRLFLCKRYRGWIDTIISPAAS